MKNTVQSFPYSPLTIRSQGSSRLWSQKENEFHSHFWIYQVSHCCQPLEETSGAVIFVDFFLSWREVSLGETLGALNDLFNNTILSLVVDRLTDSLHKNPCLHANREKNDLTLNLHLVGQHIKMHLIPDQQSTWSANDPCTQMMGLRWVIGPWKRCQWILCVNRSIHLYRHVQAPYLRKKPIETIKWSSERLFHIRIINFIREIGLYLTKFIATHILQVWYFRVYEGISLKSIHT